MTTDDGEKELPRSVTLKSDEIILVARERSERELLESREALELKTQELLEANRRLHASEALYRAALAAGRMGTWETDLIAKTRLWTPEGMALFGMNIPKSPWPSRR